MNADNKDTEDKGALEAAYRQHSSNFRTWLVAFGIGVPAFLATNKEAWAAFLVAQNARCIAYLLLAGVALQIVLALIDKYAAWFRLSVAMDRVDEDTLKDKFGEWWLKNDWPSVLIDLATIGAFAYAACALLNIFIK